jgi:hypothetical protein
VQASIHHFEVNRVACPCGILIDVSIVKIIRELGVDNY